MNTKDLQQEKQRIGCGTLIINAYNDGDRYYDSNCGSEGYYCEECYKIIEALAKGISALQEQENKFKQALLKIKTEIYEDDYNGWHNEKATQHYFKLIKRVAKEDLNIDLEEK
jgi:hypothetical protein